MRCALLAERHLGLSDGVRGLLSPLFEVIVMVADEASLNEAVARMRAEVAVVDLSLSHEHGGGGLVARLRRRFPDLGFVVVGFDDDGVGRAMLAAGADGFVAKSALATDLVPEVEAVLRARAKGASGRSAASEGENGCR